MAREELARGAVHVHVVHGRPRDHHLLPGFPEHFSENIVLGEKILHGGQPAQRIQVRAAHQHRLADDARHPEHPVEKGDGRKDERIQVLVFQPRPQRLRAGPADQMAHQSHRRVAEVRHRLKQVPRRGRHVAVADENERVLRCGVPGQHVVHLGIQSLLAIADHDDDLPFGVRLLHPSGHPQRRVARPLDAEDDFVARIVEPAEALQVVEEPVVHPLERLEDRHARQVSIVDGPDRPATFPEGFPRGSELQDARGKRRGYRKFEQQVHRNLPPGSRIVRSITPSPSRCGTW